jgi:HK97 gp10 family phage protein
MAVQSKNNLPRIQINVERALSELVRKTAFAIEAKAKELAPVDTGLLRGSITTEIKGPLKATVGTNVSYAEYQEFGTRYQKGTPFLTPAFDEETSRFTKQLVDLNIGI